jgi:hypothetical protein
LSLLTVQALDQVEDSLLFAAMTDSGEPLEEEQARRLLGRPARACRALTLPPVSAPLTARTARRQETILQTSSQRHAAFFAVKANKLDGGLMSCKPGESKR